PINVLVAKFPNFPAKPGESHPRMLIGFAPWKSAENISRPTQLYSSGPNDSQSVRFRKSPWRSEASRTAAGSGADATRTASCFDRRHDTGKADRQSARRD